MSCRTTANAAAEKYDVLLFNTENFTEIVIDVFCIVEHVLGIGIKYVFPLRGRQLTFIILLIGLYIIVIRIESLPAGKAPSSYRGRLAFIRFLA